MPDEEPNRFRLLLAEIDRHFTARKNAATSISEWQRLDAEQRAMEQAALEIGMNAVLGD